MAGFLLLNTDMKYTDFKHKPLDENISEITPKAKKKKRAEKKRIDKILNKSAK